MTRRSGRRAPSSAPCSRRCAATSSWRGSSSPTGRRTIEESGLTLWAALNAQETYLVELLAGTPGAAAETLRDSYTTLDEGGERAYLSSIAGFLAHALLAEGKLDEARALQPRE